MTRVILNTLLITGICLSLGSCNKLWDSKWMRYDEMACGSAWGSLSQTTDQKKDAIKEYYEKKGITIFKVKIIDREFNGNCLACSCETGIRIKCQVDKNDVPEMKSEGFY